MNRSAQRAALAIVSVAALATTGWSLYAVARHYDAPKAIALAAFLVFDGIAYACLHLASEAATAGRSALGARLASLGMVGVSVYLNRFHAELIDGGTAATLLFAVPSIGLLLLSELSWAGPRADARAARSEQPYRLPVFGGWAWLLAPARAGKAVKTRAVDHIEHGATPPPPQAAVSTDRHSATEVLRRRFAEMDPADAIRIAHDAQPDLPPAELAALLVTYGVIVDMIQVALVLHGPGERVTVERSDTSDARSDADQVGALPPPSKAAAILEAAAHLGPKPKAADIVDRVRRVNRITVDEPYVRTVLSREAKKAKVHDAAGIGKGGGGYA